MLGSGGLVFVIFPFVIVYMFLVNIFGHTAVDHILGPIIDFMVYGFVDFAVQFLSSDIGKRLVEVFSKVLELILHLK